MNGPSERAFMGGRLAAAPQPWWKKLGPGLITGAALMLAASSRRIMGDLVLPRTWKLLGWLATGAMGLATAAMFAASFFS
jgi:hypothetical protein